MKTVTISVTDVQWPDFQKYFLLRRPVPLDALEVPIMSDVDWMKKCIVDDIYQTLKEGKQMEAYSDLTVDITLV